MCGIAGYFGFNVLNNSNIEKCLTLMKQRGPDFNSSVRHRNKNGKFAYFLHSRLAIIDLDKRSNQPYKGDNTILSFNGEIYNYLELKSKLEKKYIFNSKSDTEVLSKLLDFYGINSLDKCEGMFAFSWIDKEGNFYLARDRFGEKPLYFLIDSKGGIYFGSEIKFIHALIGKTSEINLEHIKRYLVNGYKSLHKSEECFFKDIRTVPPGYFGTIGNSGEYVQKRYWKPNFRKEKDMTYEESVNGTKQRLIKSVEIRLRSDVPIAFCLSGGIDSNALIGIAKKELGYDVHGFSIINTDERYEEKDMIYNAVSDLNLKHTEVGIKKNNFIQGLRTLVKYHDSPISTITYYAHWHLMKVISKEGFKVSISGSAADELFSGYFDHHNAYLAAVYEKDKTRYKEALNEWKKVIEPIVRNPFLKNPNYFIENSNSRNHIYLDNDKFSKFLIGNFSESFSEIKYTQNILRNRMANELFSESVPVILHEDDLNSMFFSVENRTPFLDSKLFNWSQSIPTTHLIKNGRAKSILRDSVRGIVSDKILDNPRKVGFNVPILDYLNVEDSDVKTELLRRSPIFEIVKKKSIEEILEKKNLLNSESKFLFNFINAKIFLEEFK